MSPRVPPKNTYKINSFRNSSTSFTEIPPAFLPDFFPRISPEIHQGVPTGFPPEYYLGVLHRVSTEVFPQIPPKIPRKFFLGVLSDIIPGNSPMNLSGHFPGTLTKIPSRIRLEIPTRYPPRIPLEIFPRIATWISHVFLKKFLNGFLQIVHVEGDDSDFR